MLPSTVASLLSSRLERKSRNNEWCGCCKSLCGKGSTKVTVIDTMGLEVFGPMFPQNAISACLAEHHSFLVNHRVVDNCESTLMFFCLCSKPVSFEYYWSMTLTSSSPWSTLQCQRFIECLLCAEPQAKQALSSFIFTIIIYTRITEAIEQEVSIKSEVAPWSQELVMGRKYILFFSGCRAFIFSTLYIHNLLSE